MEHFVPAVVRTWPAAIRVRIGRHWKKTVALIGATILGVFQHEAVKGSLIWLWTVAWPWVRHAGDGALFLFLFGLTVLLLVVSYLDAWQQTRPAKPLPQRALSIEEKELIVPIRALWAKEGASAADSLMYLFGNVIEALQGRYWVELLHPMNEEMRKACERLTRALETNSAVPVEKVRDLFNEMYQAYYTLCRWIALVVDNDDLDTSREPHRRQLAGWQECNLAFQAAIELNDKRDGHHATLFHGANQLGSETLQMLLKSTAPPVAPLVRRLKRCSNDERLLLRQFAEGVKYSKDVPMPHAVFAASDALVRDGVLRRTEEAGGLVVKFSVEKRARQMIELHALGGATMEGELVVDLGHVQGTGASGSGARGGYSARP
jgi:hypothetical protein